MYFVKDFEIPKSGITDVYRKSAYATFAMEFLNLLSEGKQIHAWGLESSELEKQFEEDIIVESNGVKEKAVKKVNKKVISFTIQYELVGKKSNGRIEISDLDSVIKRAKPKTIKVGDIK